MSIKLSNQNSVIPTSIRFNRSGGVSNVGLSIQQYLLLLDRYPGAEAAYSVRKLKSTYNAPCVNVRRDTSPSVQADVYFDSNEEISLDSPIIITSGTSSSTTLGEFVKGVGYSNPDSLVSEASCYVSAWYDQSGNGNDAEQSTAGSQPKIVSAGTVVKENGLPALDFDGADDQLTDSFGTTYNQPTYTFVVHNYTSVPSAFSGLIGSIGGEHRLILNGTLAYTISAGGSLAYNSYSTEQSLISYKMQQSDPKFFFNGTQQSVSSGSSIGTTGLQGIVLGGLTSGSGSENSPVQIQEIIIYPSDQSANRTGIEANINRYFSIY